MIDMTNKIIKTMKAIIDEHSHCCNHNRKDNKLHKPNSSLGYLEQAINLYTDFESSNLSPICMMICLFLA